MGAYRFVAANSDHATFDGAAILSAYPYTIAAVFMADTSAANGTLIWLGDKDVTDHYVKLDYLTADDVALLVAAAGSSNSATSTGAGADDIWQTGVGVGISVTDRSAFRAGANEGTTSVSRAFPTGVDRFAVGRHRSSAPGFTFDGWIAYVAAWNVALSDAEVATFHSGTIPQPGALVAFYDFTTDQGTTIVDLIGSADLTVSGAVYDGAVTPSPTFSLNTTTPLTLSATQGQTPAIPRRINKTLVA